MKTLNLRHSINRSPLRLGFLLVPLVLICFAFLPRAQAGPLSPIPDGAYAGDNTAEGGNTALFNLSTGANNTALGVNAMFLNTTGNKNTAVGDSALKRNTSGKNNTATGIQALFNNQTASNNTADGNVALFSNRTGTSNTATGSGALFTVVTGSGNTAHGFNALSNSTADNNTALGVNAGTDQDTGTNDIYIGDRGFAGEDDVIAIGAISATGTDYAMCFIGGIDGVAVGGGTPVVVGVGGQLGVAPSSARFKEAIKPMGKDSEAIFALKPITFHYKKQVDRAATPATPQWGLVAEEVEKVNPDLISRDRYGKVFTVRYEAINAMLLNEFLKEHKKVGELEGTVAKLAATVKEQAAQIQKVSAQMEASKPAPKVVVNNP